MSQAPFPLGTLPAHRFNAKGVTLHDFGYVNFNRHKEFTKYLLWFVEINDELISLICPSDLNNLPCEWDELHGGCQMMRLCEVKCKHPHPHLNVAMDQCSPEWQQHCQNIHDVQPTCRSIAKALREKPDEAGERQVKYQLCEAVANNEICEYGHDLESARIEAVYRYWEHREAARMCGSQGIVQRDILGRKLLRPIKPAELEEEIDAD